MKDQHFNSPKMFSVEDCEILDLDVVHQERGNLTSLENHSSISFSVKRVYYLYDVPYGADRGGHAHDKLQQDVIAANGSSTGVLGDRKLLDFNSFCKERNKYDIIEYK